MQRSRNQFFWKKNVLVLFKTRRKRFAIFKSFLNLAIKKLGSMSSLAIFIYLNVLSFLFHFVKTIDSLLFFFIKKTIFDFVTDSETHNLKIQDERCWIIKNKIKNQSLLPLQKPHNFYIVFRWRQFKNKKKKILF